MWREKLNYWALRLWCTFGRFIFLSFNEKPWRQLRYKWPSKKKFSIRSDYFFFWWRLKSSRNIFDPPMSHFTYIWFNPLLFPALACHILMLLWENFLKYKNCHQFSQPLSTMNHDKLSKTHRSPRQNQPLYGPYRKSKISFIAS